MMIDETIQKWSDHTRKVVASGIRAVVWDLDNTLVSELDFLEYCFKDFANRINKPRCHLALRQHYIKTGNSGLFDHLVRTGLCDTRDLSVFFDCLRNSPQKGPLQIHKVAQQFLEEFHSGGIFQGVLTNGNPNQQKSKIRIINPSATAYELLVVYANEHQPKPSPLGFWPFTEAWRLPPQKILMIGDSETDREAARSFGCQFLITPPNWLTNTIPTKT
jgi:FMN phosphatase YigB (HAD superfamily)